jgi:hypothetical protein
MLVGFLAASAYAAVIELKNGQRTEGSLKQADQSTVTVEIGGQLVTFKTEQVRAIYYGSAPSSTTSASQAPSPAVEALRALKDLQSVVSSGVTYRDYGSRVADASIAVDRFLETPASEDQDARSAAREAISFYKLAGHVWSERVQGNPVGVMLVQGPDVALVEKCKGVGDNALITLDPKALTPKYRAGMARAGRNSLGLRLGAHCHDSESYRRRSVTRVGTYVLTMSVR